MIRTKFYLEKRRGKDDSFPTKNIPIIMNCSFDGKRLQHYTGERTDLNKWDEKRERLKSSCTEAFEVNALLDKLYEEVNRIYREAKLSNISNITPQYLRNQLNKDNSKGQKSVLEAYEEYIESKKHQFAVNTLKKYTTNRNHLKTFTSKYKFDLTFENIDDVFKTKFERYLLEELNHNNTTLAKDMKLLKSFLNWAGDRGYNKSLAFKKFQYKESPADILALSWEQLMHAYETKMPTLCLEQVKDVFCFGCFTGLRFSDIENLKKSDIKDNKIHITTIKTKDSLVIPLNKYSKAILEKYKDYPTHKCLPVISNQKSNEHLKKIGEILEFNQVIKKIRYKGNKTIETNHHFYELLTTHVARKTFVTNAYRKEMPTEMIMRFTGHKSPAILARYNNISIEQMSQSMDKTFN